MCRRQVTVIGIVLVIIMILFATVTFRQHAQDKSQVQQNKSTEDEATVVQKGQITNKERKYSKEYKKLYSYRQAKKISEIIELSRPGGSKQEIGTMIGVGDTFNIDDEPMPTKSEFLAGLSCKADAIVVGLTKSKAGHLTEDETFVFTEYEFLVQSILKNNSASPIELNSTIQITRPGGLIKIDGQVVRAQDLSYEPLQKNKQYLLFLRFIPAANGYVVSSKEGDFVLESKSLKTLSKVLIPQELINNDSQSLLNDIRNSVSSGCNKTSPGGNQ